MSYMISKGAWKENDYGCKTSDLAKWRINPIPQQTLSVDITSGELKHGYWRIHFAFRSGTKILSLHTLWWVYKFGIHPPAGYCLLHFCGLRDCCNHTFLGNQTQNLQMYHGCKFLVEDSSSGSSVSVSGSADIQSSS